MDHNMDFGVNFGQDGSPEKKNVPPGFGSDLRNATQNFLANELGGGFSQQQKAQENVHNIFSHDLDDDFRDITSQSHPLDDHHMKQSHGDEDFEHDSLNFLPSSAHKDNANENVKVISSKDLLDDFDVFTNNKKTEAEQNINQFVSDKSDLLANVGEQIKSNIKDNVDKTNQFMDDLVGLTSTTLSSNQNDTPKHISSDIKKDLFDDFGFDKPMNTAQKPSAPEPKQFSDDEFFNSSTGSSPAKSKITKNTSDNDKFISNESLENLRSKVEDIKEKVVEDIKDIKGKIQPPKKNIMQGEVIFHKPGDNPGHYKTSINIHPLLESLIYWRDIKVSAVVFTIGLILLLALTLFSVISVIAYTSLIILTTSIGFRIYKYVMAMVSGDSSSNETENPFEQYLNADIDISQERTKQLVGVTVASLNAFASELKKLFLVEDYVESIKFGIILWILTYIGSWFNGMTLIILAYILLFTIPIVYEHNKPLIDQNMEFARAKVSELQDKIMAILPFAKPPVETDKNK